MSGGGREEDMFCSLFGTTRLKSYYPAVLGIVENECCGFSFDRSILAPSLSLE